MIQIKKSLMKNKKAQIFILLSVFIIILLFASYEIYTITQDTETVKKRVKTMDSFVFSIEKDLSRRIYVFGYRFLFEAEGYILKNGTYISNLTDLLQESFTNGTVYGNQSQILQDAYLSAIESSINENAKSMNIITNISNARLSLYQETPWQVIFLFEANLTVKDISDLARWNKQENIKVPVNIEGFEDPLFVINGNGRVSRKLQKTNYTLSSSTIALHLSTGSYIENQDAPSFIKRLEGKLEPDANGIESLVDLQDFDNQGLVTRDKSIVDHIYFSSYSPSSCHVAGMQSWFKLDASHLPVYNVICG